MVEHLPGIIEQRAGRSLTDNLLQVHPGIPGSFHQGIQRVHISLQMLSVVVIQRFPAQHRLQRIRPVRQFRQYERSFHLGNSQLSQHHLFSFLGFIFYLTAFLPRACAPNEETLYKDSVFPESQRIFTGLFPLNLPTVGTSSYVNLSFRRGIPTNFS